MQTVHCNMSIDSIAAYNSCKRSLYCHTYTLNTTMYANGQSTICYVIYIILCNIYADTIWGDNLKMGGTNCTKQMLPDGWWEAGFSSIAFRRNLGNNHSKTFSFMLCRVIVTLSQSSSSR